jgi:hypothetical protein
MRCHRVLLVTCLLVLAAPAAASAGFVQRSGTNLSLDGSAFRFVGHNNYQLTSVAGQFTCGRALDGAMVDRVLQDAKDAGATVIRTWFFQSFYRGAGNSYAPFDRVLDKAAAKGLKVIPVLVNHYPDCEPSGAKRKDEGFYDYGYKTAGWGYPQSFKDYAYNLASRYRNNATIAFWQIVNEAETSWSGGCNTTIEANGHQRAANVLRRFVDDNGRRDPRRGAESPRVAGNDRHRPMRGGRLGVSLRARIRRQRHLRRPRLRPCNAADAGRPVQRPCGARLAVQRDRQADADRRVGHRRRRRLGRRLQRLDHRDDAEAPRRLLCGEAERRVRQRHRRLPAVGEDR